MKTDIIFKKAYFDIINLVDANEHYEVYRAFFDFCFYDIQPSESLSFEVKEVVAILLDMHLQENISYQEPISNDDNILPS